ncbi:MAG: 50S ribosomal protein L19 [Candidatus Coatesbacteria bacterium]|nr:50S ribosomal protein L19 [Candidatus Coatesbacteria bacterium]
MQRIQRLEQEQLRENVPAFNVGDTIEVAVKITEASKTRIQKFQGIVIAKKHGGLRETFTVRRTTGTGNIGVERIFPLHSPNVSDIRVVRRGSTKRAKLYYLREKIGRAARVKDKRLH